MINKTKKILILTAIAIYVMCGFFALPTIAAPGDIPYNKIDMNFQVPIPFVKLTDPAKCTDDTSKLCNNWIAEYIAGVYKYGVAVAGILATITMMIGGVMWILSAGNPGLASDAKAWINSSALGLVLVLTSYMILYQVNPMLVRPVTIKTALIDIPPEEAIASFTAGDGTQGTNVTSKIDIYDDLLRNAAGAAQIECALMKATMYAESGGNPSIESPAHAVGLMQLLPSTAGLTKDQLKNPALNIQASATYFRKLKTSACNGKTSNEVCNVNDIKYIIAAYNGGPKANTPSVTCPGKTYWECESNAGYRETRNYVKKVIANIETIKNTPGYDCR